MQKMYQDIALLTEVKITGNNLISINRGMYTINYSIIYLKELLKMMISDMSELT